ncbi:TPA_asm: hypothetical protein F8438_22275 [Salmonella enterica]|nr:hypothetical protein [Salmonella enterica]
MCRTLAACSLALPATCPGSHDLQGCDAVPTALITPVRTGIHARTAIGSRWRCHQAAPSTHAGVPHLPRLGSGVSPPHCSQEIHHDHFQRKVLL